MKLEKIKSTIKEMSKYLIITALFTASFFLGVYYDSFKNRNGVITKVKRDDVNIAIDEYNHLIIIDRKSGDYVVYQDSIGNSIFKLYAKSIWNKHKLKT